MMAVYGFIIWRKHSNSADDIRIHRKSWKFHIGFIASGITITLIIGFFLSQSPDTRLPYLDSLVTVFSVMITVLMARKVLESWLYWIVIDSLAIILYWKTGFYVTIIMFMVYLVAATYGYINWKKLYTKAN